MKWGKERKGKERKGKERKGQRGGQGKKKIVKGGKRKERKAKEMKGKKRNGIVWNEMEWNGKEKKAEGVGPPLHWLCPQSYRTWQSYIKAACMSDHTRAHIQYANAHIHFACKPHLHFKHASICLSNIFN